MHIERGTAEAIPRCPIAVLHILIAVPNDTRCGRTEHFEATVRIDADAHTAATSIADDTGITPTVPCAAATFDLVIVPGVAVALAAVNVEASVRVVGDREILVHTSATHAGPTIPCAAR